MLNDYIEREDCGVSIKQAKQVRESFVKGKLNERTLKGIFMQEEKQEKFYLDFKRLKEYFPKEYTVKQCEEALWKILDKIWK